ncbi:RNase adapter RapZ [Lentibacter algarum]|uniref:RNase adapter RapZ n=1 Tax=Lentibacter algarum TaxID=576131 RepID=UPI001C09A3E3|nr:RNase adapter RapZ [Lentibacter algarum]MBU2983632.1 RNase adapter RapZ [Lentibacter algarum]
MSITPKRLVFVTGPSGAGRSTAIGVLEDLGFEAIDNLPLSLVERLLDGPPLERPLALGLDVRNRDFSASALLDTIDASARRFDVQAELLYLDSREDVLLRRFSETRRRHPLAPHESPALGVRRELDLLASVRTRADVLIDTSELSPHDLRAELSGWFGDKGTPRLALSVQSFSYKRGLPRGVDMVLDCRFLRNPHWQEELRGMTGLDPAVQDYVKDDARYESFFTQVRGLALELLPAYREEGKAHFSLAFGCSGGRHRSVTLAEMLAKALAEHDWQVSIRHRELERRAVGPKPDEPEHGSRS